MNGKCFRILLLGAVAAAPFFVGDANAFSESPSSIIWAPPPPVYFRFGSTRLDREARRRLAIYARLAKDNAKTQLSIAGYTDTVGTAPTNLTLSAERALAVKAHLTTLGVRPEQMTAIGRGELSSLTGPQDSRRVQIDVWMAGLAIFDDVPFSEQGRVPLVVHLPDDDPRTIHLRIVSSKGNIKKAPAEITLGPGDPRILRPPHRLHIGDLSQLFAIEHAGAARVEVRISPGVLFWPMIGVTDQRGRVQQRIAPK